MYRNPIHLLLALLLALVFAVPALAQKTPSGERIGDGRQSAGKQSDVIDISGFMEWPKGDTRMGWGRPQAFSRGTDLVFGLALKRELFRTGDRESLSRRMEAERRLGR